MCAMDAWHLKKLAPVAQLYASLTRQSRDASIVSAKSYLRLGSWHQELVNCQHQDSGGLGPLSKGASSVTPDL